MKTVSRATVLLVSVACAVGLAPAGHAAQAKGPATPSVTPSVAREGEQYVSLRHPQEVARPATREVLEVFWYGCEHSQLLEQPLEEWAARQPSDVVLRRLPAVWPGGPDETVQLAHARLYFTLERLGEVDRLQRAVFRAVREQGVDLTTEEAAARWAAGRQVDGQRFRAAYESEEVRRRTEQAPQDLARYEIAELPSAVVQGRYLTSPSRAGGVPQLPGVLDQLLAQVRTVRP